MKFNNCLGLQNKITSKDEIKLNNIINANIQNNIKTIENLDSPERKSFNVSDTNSKENIDIQKLQLKNGINELKKKKIDPNKSTNFHETMSKIFSDLNKTLDAVNMSMGRVSKEDSEEKKGEKKLGEGLMNIFKNNFESEEKKKKERSKSWVDVTREINQKMEENHCNSPEIKNKSKSLIMTDLNEFCLDIGETNSVNKNSLETKKGQFVSNKNIDNQMNENEEFMASPENKYESQSACPNNNVPLPNPKIYKNSVFSVKQRENKKVQKKKINKLLNMNINLNLSGTLPESNALDYIHQTESESEKKEKFYFHPDKGVVSKASNKLNNLIKKNFKASDSILRIYSKGKYEDDLISKKSENRFISYKRNRYKKYLVDKNIPQSLTDNYIQPRNPFIGNKQKNSSSKRKRLSNSNSKNIKLNSIRTRYRNGNQVNTLGALPDDKSKLFLEDVTSKYTEGLQSHQRYPFSNAQFNSEYSNFQQPYEKKKNYNLYKQENSNIKFYSNINNNIDYDQK